MRIPSLVVIAATLVASAVAACSSSEEPQAVDDRVAEGHPGTLVITAPARAAFVEGDGSALLDVRGTGATSALTINGEPVRPDADGRFHTTIKPQRGLNLLVATDGDARLESPFLYGHFEQATTAVPHAVALDVGGLGMAGPLPIASLESVTNLALSKRALVGALVGQTFEGEVTGATWAFRVNRGLNGAATVGVEPRAKGLDIKASVRDVSVDGQLAITSLGVTYARDVRITVGSASVAGKVDLAVDGPSGALTAAMPEAAVRLGDFFFDTDNAGFPCCVDTILTDFIRPKIELAIGDGIRVNVPSLVKVTLEGVGLPRELSYAGKGFALKIPLAARFDGASFDPAGGTLTAATLFGGAAAPGTPGARAPGWLALGLPYAEAPTHAPGLGVSFALDAVNQLLFAAWSNGSLTYDAPAPLGATLSCALPPVVAVTEAGALRIALGEVRVQRHGSPHPLAGVPVVQDVAPSGDGDALVLTPKGDPKVSITWLTEDTGANGRDLVASAARTQLAKLLVPLRLPVPRFALSALGPGFEGQSLAIQSPAVAVDRAGRISATGKLTIVP
jgi:hypothetical protein